MDICYECLKPTVKKHGALTLTKAGYGSYEVPGVIHYACDICGAKIIPPDEAERVELEGIRLHMLKELQEHEVLTALELKELVRSSAEYLEKAALQLVKENKITVDYSTPSEPKISINSDLKPKGLLDRLKAWIERNKHNFY